MSTLLRTSALVAALALLGAGVAEARGGRSSVGGSRSSGSSFSRAASRSSGSSFSRSSTPRSFSRSVQSPSSFSRSQPSPSFRTSTRTVRTPTYTAPQVRAPQTFASSSRGQVRTPSAGTWRTPTVGAAQGAGAAARNAAAMDRLRTWNRARTTTGTPQAGLRSTRSAATVPTTRVPTYDASRVRSSLGSRVPQRTAASSGGDTVQRALPRVRTPSAQADRIRERFGGASGVRVARSAVGTRTPLGEGTRSFGGGATTGTTVRSGTVRTGSDLRSIAREGRLAADGTRASLRTSGTRTAARFGGDRAGVRQVSGGRGAVRYTASSRGSVRYSGGTGGYYGHGHGHGHPYRGYYGSWYGHGYWGYPCTGWGWGIGFGFTLAYWDPWYYANYGCFWVGGAPAFGFGTVYYGPSYSSYFTEPIVIEQPVYVVQEPVYVQPEGVAPEGAAPVAPAPVAPPAEEAAPPAEGEPEAPEAPGYQDFQAGVDAFLQGDYEAALVHFRAASQADEKNGEAWMALAHAAFATGRYEEAAVAIAQAGNLGAFPRGYRYDPKPMYPQEGRFDELLGKLKVYRAQHPEDANAHLVAAYFHVALGQQTEASQALTQVLQIRPDDETAPILTLAMLPPLPPEQAPEGAAAPTAQR